MRFINKKSILVIGLLLLLSVPSILPLFHAGFFVGDDGPWMIIRSSAFHQALRDGQFPVRFLGRLNHEFGYPVSTFLYPGYLYMVEPLYLFKIGVVNVIKIMYGLTMLSSALFAYLWLSKLYKKEEALIGSLVSLYAPYHLADIYVRGSLGELLALAIVPFVMWQVERRSFLYTSLGIGLLVLSHNTMALIFLPIIFLYMLMRFGKAQIKNIVFTFLIGAMLSAFFWIPALLELKNTIFSQTKISEWQNYFARINTIGLLPVMLFSASAAYLILGKLLSKSVFFKITKNRNIAILFTAVGLISIFLSSEISKPIWYLLPVSFIQFPFRFLSIEVVALSVVTASLLSVIKNTITKVIFIIIILIVLFIYSKPYYAQIKYFDYGDGYYSTNEGTTTTRDEYTPIWVREKPLTRPAKKVEIVDGIGEIQGTSFNNSKIVFTADIRETDAIIQVATIYWPGWRAYVGRKPVAIDYSNPKGLMEIVLPPGVHRVELKFAETNLRLLSDAISIGGLVILLFVVKKKMIKL